MYTPKTQETRTLKYTLQPITMAELESTLENKGRSAPGNDSTTYEIIKNCPKEFKN